MLQKFKVMNTEAHKAVYMILKKFLIFKVSNNLKKEEKEKRYFNLESSDI